MSTDTGIMNMEDRYTLTDLPEMGEWYYLIFWPSDFSTLDCMDFRFTASGGDYALIAAGMAFKTQEAAERNKYAVYKALTGKEWEEREDARHE